MYRVINKYMENINLIANDDIYNRLMNFLKTAQDIKKYSVTVSFNRYVVDIKLENYSVERAADIFQLFSAKVSYAYSSMHLRFNEGKCVRYRYITCMENKKGFYCDIIFS